MRDNYSICVFGQYLLFVLFCVYVSVNLKNKLLSFFFSFFFFGGGGGGGICCCLVGFVYISVSVNFF